MRLLKQELCRPPKSFARALRPPRNVVVNSILLDLEAQDCGGTKSALKEVFCMVGAYRLSRTDPRADNTDHLQLSARFPRRGRLTRAYQGAPILSIQPAYWSLRSRPPGRLHLV